MGNTGSKDSNIAENWKELSGKNNWDRLLVPLSDNLRKVIVHYGKRVQAIYDAINENGLPLYIMEDFLSKVGLETDEKLKLYTVTNYLYGVSDVDSSIDWIIKDQSAWIGYVAVSTDEGKAQLGKRDILISWRGTLLAAEWFKDLQVVQISASDLFLGSHDINVHHGFHSLYTSKATDSQYNKESSARDQVLAAVKALVDQYKDEEISITITGHSLGAALATLNAADIVSNNINKIVNEETGRVSKDIMVTVFVFACPKVGNEGFKILFGSLNNLHMLHIRHNYDIVPKLPPFSVYKKVGKEVRINGDAKFLPLMLSDWHELKNYLKIIEEM